MTYAATATDLVDGARAVACVPASGSTFALGSVTVNCSASDTRGNTATGHFSVTVQDTTPPVVTVPSDMALEASGATGAVATFASSATDMVSGTVVTVCTPVSGSTFPLGTTSVSCSATDAAGNSGSKSFSVTVKDTTPPLIAAHADQTEEATSAAGAIVSYSSPATTDAVDGTSTAVCLPASGSSFPFGPTPVTCNAMDAAGNHALPVTFTVTVTDTTAPVIDAHADVTAEATSASGALVTIEPGHDRRGGRRWHGDVPAGLGSRASCWGSRCSA